MRASRLLSILITLQLRGRVSARELAEKFEVSKRTIYRDVDELSAAGVPIYAELGATGGFALLDGWRTQLTGMTSAEAETLLLAGMPGQAVELGLGLPAATARLKLLAALPSQASESAERVADRFHLDPTPWHHRPARPPPALRTLAQAVWEARRMRISYESWTGVTDRVVEPLGIILKAGEWYFLALRKRGSAVHRLASVAEAVLLPEHFERPAPFNLAASWQAAVERFETGLRRGEARLRVKPAALSRIERLGADMADPIFSAAPDRQGVREAAVSIESIGHAASLLLGFADDIEVVAPPELREQILLRARAVVSLYEL